MSLDVVLSSVRQDSEWEFDLAIRESLGLCISNSPGIQNFQHPALLDHDYIKGKLVCDGS